ncbi:hypothetical protein HPB50_008452 [Hyalomma asiaticum]|uniref:Uncharacterized protein n=1 Tax=Hyalomma asiaticum TaxID=266040 RepID=A0ACB7T6Z3_HYAAI|nr:hypothetical protein HPB50_008452 [Hyalomma asiaticum]
MIGAAPKRVALVLLAMAICKSTSAPTSGKELSDARRAALAMEGDYFEGDIITDEYPEIGRVATSNKSMLWPGGVVPYATDTTLGSQYSLEKIREAMDSIEEKTCLRFVPREDQKDYLMLRSLDGCYSYIGRQGGEQTTSLGDGCIYKGLIIHELLHTVGFYHEHTRPDRDKYVTVFLKNVIPGQLHQFAKIDRKEIRPLGPFDYDSIMLYGSDAFSRSEDLHTMVKKDGSLLTAVYLKTGLSDRDVRRIKNVYNCTTQ